MTQVNTTPARLSSYLLDTTLVGNGNGTFTHQILGLSIPAGPTAIGDFNRDGKLDVVTGYSNYSPSLGLLTLVNLSTGGPILSVLPATFVFGALAPGSLGAAFGGANLAVSTASANTAALPTNLAGTTVSVEDSAGDSSPAGLFYVSPTQVNFLMPQALATGPGTITVTSSDGRSLSTRVQVDRVAPSIFMAGTSAIPAGYMIYVDSAGNQTSQPIYQERGGVTTPVPIDVSNGDVYLVLFGTGFDTPSQGSAYFTTCEGCAVLGEGSITYSGPQGSFPGLDQVNIHLPQSLSGRGNVLLILGLGGRSGLVITNLVFA